MTAKIGLLILIASLSILVSPVFAKTATPPAAVRKEVVKDRIEAKKVVAQDRVTAMKEKIATREAALKAKLAAFKDKRKAQVAERVNTNLNKINQNYTDQARKHLERMSTLLDKLEQRVNNGSPDIKDSTAAKAAISESRARITAALASIETQAQKDYTLTVTTEAKVKADAQKMRDLLKTDIQALREQIIAAKQSVSNAIRVAKSGKAPTQSAKEGTPSGQ